MEICRQFCDVAAGRKLTETPETCHCAERPEDDLLPISRFRSVVARKMKRIAITGRIAEQFEIGLRKTHGLSVRRGAHDKDAAGARRTNVLQIGGILEVL